MEVSAMKRIVSIFVVAFVGVWSVFSANAGMGCPPLIKLEKEIIKVDGLKYFKIIKKTPRQRIYLFAAEHREIVVIAEVMDNEILSHVQIWSSQRQWHKNENDVLDLADSALTQLSATNRQRATTVTRKSLEKMILSEKKGSYLSDGNVLVIVDHQTLKENGVSKVLAFTAMPGR
jgi:hypothetical protein